MKAGLKTPKTLMEAIVMFADPKVCFEFAVALRWGDDVQCPFCGSDNHSFMQTRQTWQCKNKECKKQFSVKKGTIFEDSPIKLDKWFAAMWLIANAKNGISSCELARSLGVTQKTAWFMNHRIREAMSNGSIEKLSGEVEADETFIGGSIKNMHYDKRPDTTVYSGWHDKTIVMGVVQRGGKGYFEVIRRRRGTDMKPIIDKYVEKGSTMYTDNHGGYHGLYKNYQHGVVDHSVAYVFGSIHTNTCEAFWSLLKRSMKGTYVSVEPIHLHRYLHEYGFRYNTRDTNDSNRFLKVLSQIAGRRLTYAELTGKELAAFA